MKIKNLDSACPYYNTAYGTEEDLRVRAGGNAIGGAERQMVRTLVMVIARMMLCGVTPALAQQDHSASDEKLYENVQKQFAEAYNRQNADAMAALFSENGIRVTPNGIFQGRDAIRRGLRHVLAMGLHDYTVRRTSPIRRVISFSMSVNGKPSWAIGSSTGINQSATCS